MLTTPWPDPKTGLSERVAVSQLYGEITAEKLGYVHSKEHSRAGVRVIYLRKKSPPKTSLYWPGVEWSTHDMAILSESGVMRITFQDEPLGGGAVISCRMTGVPWEDEGLHELFGWWRHLPYSALVAEKVIEQADFLDLNPMYRGLPGIAAGRTAPSVVETGPPAKPDNWDWT